MIMLGMLTALASALCWTIGAILFKKLSQNISPIGFTLIKGIISCCFFGIVLLFIDFEAIKPKTFYYLSLSGIIGISLGDTFFFLALKRLYVHVILILFMLGQVFTVILAIILLNERQSLLSWVGIALVISGIGIVIGFQKVDKKDKKFHFNGIIFGLLSIICMSFSTIITKTYIVEISSIQTTFIRLLSGTLGIFIIGLVYNNFTGLYKSINKESLTNLLSAIIIGTIGGFWLYHIGIKNIDVALANTLSSTEPLFGVIIGFFILKEKINLPTILGLVIAMIGISLIFIR